MKTRNMVKKTTLVKDAASAKIKVPSTAFARALAGRGKKCGVIHCTPQSWLATFDLQKSDGMFFTERDFELVWGARPKVRPSYEMYGKPVQVPRDLQLYHDEKQEKDRKLLVVTVRQNSFKAKSLNDKDKYLEVLRRVLASANKALPKNEVQDKKTYNAIVVNWYPSGQDYIGWHADSEKGIDFGLPIISTSYYEKGGKTAPPDQLRCFKARTQPGKTLVSEIQLKHNFGVMMGGNFQKELKHMVPRTKKPVPRRINFTLRRYDVSKT